MIYLILIALIITFVWDYSGFPQKITARFLSIIRGKEITVDRVVLREPWFCSLCMTFWVTLIFQMFTVHLSLIGMVIIISKSLLMAYSTKPILYIYNIIDLIVNKIYKTIYNLIDKF